jgi:PAS domain S-box-containing protein
MANQTTRSMAAPPARSKAMAYIATLAAVAAATALRVVIDPWIGDDLPFVTMFGAVAAAAWFGGVFHGLLATALAYLATHYFFMAPRGVFGAPDGADFVGLIAYLFSCAIIILFAEISRRSRAAASERQEVLRVTLRSIGDAVITTDVAARVSYMNDVAEQLTGWTRADADGHPLDDVFRIVNEATRRPAENPAARALREGTTVGLANHTILIRKDGVGECPIDDSAAPIRDEAGRVSGCVLIFRDVTKARSVERDKAAQLVTARMLASIIESSDDAIISKSLQGIILSWNHAAEQLFGYTAEQAIGKHISIVIPPDRLAEEDLIISRLKSRLRVDHFETERVRADGRRIHVSLTISPLVDEDGNVTGASKIVRDITERKQAEAERQKFVSLIENSIDFIGISDLHGEPTFVNRAGLELVGLDSLDAARRVKVEDFFFPEDRARIVNEFLPRVRSDGHAAIEVRFRNFKTGEARWMIYKVWTLPGPDGRPLGFATVSPDITARKKLEDDLRALAADLSDADRRKNEFLAMLAHELRNPLAPISNATQWLRLGQADPAAVRAASQMLDRQVGQMSRLVDDLLDVSRITRGRIELRREEVELAPIVDQAVEAVRAQFADMNHKLTIEVPTSRILVNADPARLAQIIGNLLNNACKFTDRGGQVWLTVGTEGDQAVIRVRDSGIGIAAADLPRLFRMFSQLDTSLERSRGGLGIGLTLVKTLTEMHGGHVSVTSAGPGTGSEFVIRLPLTLAPGAPPVAPAPAAERRRVLIVDDSADGAESLAMLLEFIGHETHVAHDGHEAVAEAERLRPDVMLLDIGLPGLNGYEVCTHIRQQPWGRDMKLVAVTGWGQEEDRYRSHEAGFDAHLVKPVSQERLTEVLAPRT